MMIDFKNVSFRYDTDQELVLKNISLQIEKGDFVALIGHNGSGKSTLAKLINALLIPTEGDITVLGMNTKDEKNMWTIRQHAGMIFQNPDNQIVASIVEEDVAFGPENLGLASELIRERVDKALDGVGMTEFVTRPPHMLSGGQKQRIAIAGVLAMEPEIIIFDEATSMLDPNGRAEVMTILKELNQKGITIVLITHFMEEALQADYIYIMEQGEVALQGKPQEIFDHQTELQELNLEVPELLLITDYLRSEGIDLQPVFKQDDLVRQLCQLKLRD